MILHLRYHNLIAYNIVPSAHSTLKAGNAPVAPLVLLGVVGGGDHLPSGDPFSFSKDSFLPCLFHTKPTKYFIFFRTRTSHFRKEVKKPDKNAVSDDKARRGTVDHKLEGSGRPVIAWKREVAPGRAY